MSTTRLSYPLDLESERYNNSSLNLRFVSYVDAGTNDAISPQDLNRTTTGDQINNRTNNNKSVTDAITTIGQKGSIQAGTKGVALKLFSPKTIIEKGSIFLPMPPTINSNYGFEWADDTSLRILAMGDNIEKSTQDIVTGKDFSMSNLFNKMMQSADTISNMIGGGSNAQDKSAINSVMTMGRVADNQFSSQQFKSVKRRSFEFSWKFFPSTNEEMERIKAIVDFIKTAVHPDYLTVNGEINNSYLKFPDTVFPVFNIGGSISKYLPKIGECSVNSFSVGFGDDQNSIGFNTYREGEPTKVTMSLIIEETTALVRQDLEKGF